MRQMNIVMEKGRVLSTADLFVKMCELDQDLFYKIKPENLVEFIESRIAKFILNRGYLTDKQLEYGRRKIMKYAGQLAKVANGKLKVTV